jgi:hypothetical protein
MSGILMIPIHLDALHLTQDKNVVEAEADFSRLPYFYGSRDMNPDVANVSEDIVSKPFQNENLTLKAGIHLHWALPDALTRKRGDREHFPSVPNRWLVIRSTDAAAKEKMWVVESDYLYPAGLGETSGSVSIPDPTGTTYDAVDPDQPFRYLGRNMTYTVWTAKNSADDEYMAPFTAVGYGTPAFSAFYPNCRSVFGFHDPDYASSIPADLSYDVIGWYSDPDNDHLNKFLSTLASNTDEEKLEALKEEFLWSFELTDLASGDAFPDETVCYTRLSFLPSTSPTDVSTSNIKLSVGNTGTEALSAYLADVLDTSPGKDYKVIIEEQLEALHLASNLEHRQLDIGPKFLEARHEKGFTGFSSGTLWSVKPTPDHTQAASAEDAHKQQQITLPDEMAHQLNDLNTKQRDYDRAVHEIESLRSQLFSDWYKYMLCAYPPDGSRDEYPDIDAVKYYIENNSLVNLQTKISYTGQLTMSVDDDGIVTAAAATGTPTDSLAHRLAEAVNTLYTSVANHNATQEVIDANSTYILTRIPGPRYWQPREPVILVTGDAAEPSIRYGYDGRHNADGYLECGILQTSSTSPVDTLIKTANFTDTVTSKIDSLQTAAGNNQHIAFATWTQAPWHPLKLEWEVEMFPLREKSNHTEPDGNYTPDFIENAVQLEQNSAEATTRPGKGGVAKGANIYAGSSILTPHAGKQLQESIYAYLKKQTDLEDFYTAQGTPKAEQNLNHLGTQIDTLKSWYETQNAAGLGTAEQKAKDPVYTAIQAFKTVKDLHLLSQCLGGFNDALLQHKQTFQLKIADPLAFGDYKAFTDNVRAAVGNYNRSAPQPLIDFNPIRTGALELLRLRLVDSFGRAKSLTWTDYTATETLPKRENSHLLTMPPRYVQPTRLNFRWISAGDDRREMNAHPATTPVCGWLLTNNLDGSLMIYDNNGKALGYIDEECQWRMAPGAAKPYYVDEIENTHLKQVVKHILARGKAHQADFITAVDSALENIDPDNYAHHQDLALYMGRPVAIVRAALNLEIMGIPALHQGWTVFRQDMRSRTRNANGFHGVRVPVRIGEYKQLNDGLVGYWKETADGYEDGIFYASQATDGADDKIKTHASDPANINQSFDSGPVTLTMLVDPRGKVHATTGMHPAKAIEIPPDQYAQALKNIEITFLSAPVLADPSTMELPLPMEGGYTWSWQQADIRGEWTGIYRAPTIKKEVFLNRWGGDDAESVWEYLMLETTGWLKPVEGNSGQAFIAPEDDDRAKAVLDGVCAGQEEKIKAIFDRNRLQVKPPRTEATFSGRTQLNDGWLKLSKAQ